MANATFVNKFIGGNSNDRVIPGKENSFAKIGALYKGTNHMGRSVAYEPQRLYNFELQIVGLDQLYTADNAGTGAYEGSDASSNAEYVRFASASERILVACSSFSVPDTSVGLIEIPHYNNVTKYAGKTSFGNATLVIEQFLGSFTEQIMTTWARCVYDPRTQNIGYKNDYAKDMFVIQYDSKGGTPRVWKMENAWPRTLPGAQWAYDAEGRRQMSYTIECDRCIPDYGIDPRTFSQIPENPINSITKSAINGTTQYIKYGSEYSGKQSFQDVASGAWEYDPVTKSYINPSTGAVVQGYSNLPETN